MEQIYWITVLRHLGVFCIMLAFVSIVCLSLFIAFFIDKKDSAEKYKRYNADVFKTDLEDAIIGANRWKKLIFIVLPITFIAIIGAIFIPIKNEAYMIYGLGGTIDYLKENPQAKQLPEKTLQMLNAWENNQIKNLQKDTTENK